MLLAYYMPFLLFIGLPLATLKTTLQRLIADDPTSPYPLNYFDNMTEQRQLFHAFNFITADLSER